MRLKTYKAASMSDAIDRIRKDLGEAAIIVSSYEEKDGSVQVSAAVEETFNDDTVLNNYHDALHAINRICYCLEYHNVPQDISERLIAVCSDEAHKGDGYALASAMKKELPFMPLWDFNQKQTPILLVGPPGVGKTAGIARLAVSASLCGKKVHVITTDVLKAGALAQLTQFATALSMTIDTASSPEGLSKALNRSPEDCVIMVDTPGVNPYLSSDLRFLAEMVLVTRVAPTLVLPAGGDPLDVQDMVGAFAQLGTRRLIVGKLDVAKRYGGMMAALFNSPLHLVAFSNSPYVAEPFMPFTAEALADTLLQ